MDLAALKCYMVTIPGRDAHIRALGEIEPPECPVVLAVAEIDALARVLTVDDRRFTGISRKGNDIAGCARFSGVKRLIISTVIIPEPDRFAAVHVGPCDVIKAIVTIRPACAVGQPLTVAVRSAVVVCGKERRCNQAKANGK